MPEIRPVTKENWQSLIKLKVRDDQKNFVASNLYSIAQSHFGDEFEGHWDLFAYGIYEDDTPVGFLMYGLNFAHPSQQAYIQRLMVDEKFQGKGYGRFGMQKMLEIFRAEERVKEVSISYEPENDVARKLYASLDFVETGRIIEDEVEAVLKLK
ncbi:MAG TPA: GNAT family N-acetyltransferase [Anaerolineales bacterium]|jgi:diamine N-acetyltransferase|nr:GNAT family N-acetyltransferase [Anaerolineales bacterium]HQX17255.1 GNAT family N-acetyltransferase [Anaerolineales bacterium]